MKGLLILRGSGTEAEEKDRRPAELGPKMVREGLPWTRGSFVQGSKGNFQEARKEEEFPSTKIRRESCPHIQLLPNNILCSTNISFHCFPYGIGIWGRRPRA